MKCNCEKCDCDYPMLTYVGTGTYLDDATLICSRCNQNLECRKCKGEEE